MAAYFLDSSAAVKLYVVERGTAWLTKLVEPAEEHEIFVVRITAVEIAAALFRRVKAGALSPDQASAAVDALNRDIASTFRVVEFTPAVSQQAIKLARQHGLRGYDCIQLAASLLVRRAQAAAQLTPLSIVSSDHELNAAVRSEGLQVSDPNDYV